MMRTPPCSVHNVVAETRQIHTDLKKRDGTATLKGRSLQSASPLSQEKSALTLALTGFYCFSGHIILRLVLIYYTQIHFRWLSFTENKGEDVNYIKKEGYLQI